MKGVATYTGVFALTLVFFVFVPQIDLATSRLFYAAGQGFPMSDWRPVVILYHVVPWITWAILALVGAAAIWLFLVGEPMWGLDRKALIFIFLTIALGPG